MRAPFIFELMMNVKVPPSEVFHAFTVHVCHASSTSDILTDQQPSLFLFFLTLLAMYAYLRGRWKLPLGATRRACAIYVALIVINGVVSILTCGYLPFITVLLDPAYWLIRLAAKPFYCEYPVWLHLALLHSWVGDVYAMVCAVSAGSAHGLRGMIYNLSVAWNTQRALTAGTLTQQDIKRALRIAKHRAEKKNKQHSR